MLETTLTTSFVPSSNLKGTVAGANWSYLLPRLTLDQVVCIGMPSATMLTTLANLSQAVLVVTTDAAQSQAPSNAHQIDGWSNVQLSTSADGLELPLSNQSADLIVLIDGQAIRRLSWQPSLIAELRRILKPGGLLYYEYRGVIDPLRADNVLREFAQGVGIPQYFWLTPLQDDMHTAVPLSDQAMIRYFLRHKLYSASFGLRAGVKMLWRSKRQRVVGQSKLPVNKAATAKRARPTKGSRSFVRKIARHSRPTVLRALNRVETILNRQWLPNRFVQRQGVLIGPGELAPEAQPPHYLRTIAGAAGVDLDNYRWGLVARGRYSSRKLLFFLFDRTQEVAEPSPTYIVKMVRAPVFNARLENEGRALVWLQEQGIGDRETLPQVVFSSHHAGLALVGETIIDGAPFRQKTNDTATCPYVLGAIDWLTELGAVTANPGAASPMQVAAGMQQLFAQFAAIYQLTPAQHTFLADQIATLERSQAPIPLVFQHGDPGTWNVLVTKTGRVAFLDWEAAEVEGMPLWDLFYFLRSYCVGAARSQGVADPVAGFAQQFLGKTQLGQLVRDATQRYCARTGLSAQLVEPLFYMCWMHRALKEATRLPPTKLERGHYINLLRLCIDQRDLAIRNGFFAS